MIDTCVRNRLEQEFGPIPRQVVAVRPGQEAAIAVMDDILGIGPIPDEGRGIGQGSSDGGGDPAVDGIVGKTCSGRLCQFRLPEISRRSMNGLWIAGISFALRSTTPQVLVCYRELFRIAQDTMTSPLMFEQSAPEGPSAPEASPAKRSLIRPWVSI